MKAAPGMTPERARLFGFTPFQNAIGLETLESGGGRTVVRIPASPLTATSATDARPHPLVLGGLTDQGLAHALATVIPDGAGMSTYDLLIRFAPGPMAEGPLIMDSRVKILTDRSGNVDGDVHDSSGRLVATASGLFRVGGYPGGAPPDYDRLRPLDPATLDGPFEQLIGLEDADEAPRLRAGNRAILGWESGNVVHGGATAALLMAACEAEARRDGEARDKWLSTILIRYLRPVLGAEPLLSEAGPDRRGRACSFISARVFHKDGPTLATAQASYAQP